MINISAKGSSVSKGESLRDTVLTVAAMGVDALVIRHPASGAPWQASRWIDAHVLNAGDGTHEHPTGVAGCLHDPAASSAFGPDLVSFDGKTVAIVGDITHSQSHGATSCCSPRWGAGDPRRATDAAAGGSTAGRYACAPTSTRCCPMPTS